MVVLSVLDTGLPTTPARTGFAPDRLADCCHLPDGGRRQHCGRMVFVISGSPRKEWEHEPQDGNAELRGQRGTNYVGAQGGIHVGSGFTHRPGGGGASGVLV